MSDCCQDKKKPRQEQSFMEMVRNAFSLKISPDTKVAKTCHCQKGREIHENNKAKTS